MILMAPVVAESYDESQEYDRDYDQDYEENLDSAYNEEEEAYSEGDSSEENLGNSDAYLDNQDTYDDYQESEQYTDVSPEPVPTSLETIHHENVYSGNEHIKIERTARKKVTSESAKSEIGKDGRPWYETGVGESDESGRSTEFYEQAYKGQCDPEVTVVANQEKRFDVLKELAEQYGFEISMLEDENQEISIEKKQPLSKVIESITRDMSVVLKHQKFGDCDHLVAISVLDNSEWGGSSGRYGGGSSLMQEKIKAFKPKFNQPGFIKREQEDGAPNRSKFSKETRQLIEERRERRRELKGMRRLNDELENGDQLKNDFNVRGKWKVQKEHIDDMETYVQEVLDGSRKPNLRGMSTKQRSEYLHLRREMRKQQSVE